MPNAQSDPWSHPPVQTLDPVLRVDVPQRLTNGQILRPLWIVLFALHFHTDDLNRLIPRAQPTAQPAGHDLFQPTELLTILLPRHFPQRQLGRTRESESRTPVGRLADRDGVDALVDPPDPLLAVDVGKGRPRARGLYALRRQLVLCDFDRLHARAEAHSGVGLCDAASHAAQDAGGEVVGAECFGVVLGFGGDEEEDGAFCGRFDPGPGDKTLIDCGRDRCVSNEYPTLSWEERR